LLSFLAFTAIFIGVIFNVTGELVVNLLYGPEYAGASNILKIHIWAGLFVFIGVGGSKWYLIEDLQMLHLYRTVYGAVINIVLNYYLIPKYSTAGAAFSTVISQAFSAYLLDWSSPKSIFLFKSKTKAIFMSPFMMMR
jgi:O-antigen/teichoic acid export membrane protein